MQYYLGVDIGTTSVKAVAFDAAGKVLLKYSEENKTFHPEENYSEQSPENVFRDTVFCIEEIISRLKCNPQFISFSAAMHSLIAVDENGNALTNCILWSDNRASKVASALHSNGLAKNIYERSGVPVHAMSPLCKIIWLKEHEPQIFDQAHKFIGIKEFIFHRLCKEFIVDSSIASATGLMNIHTQQWDEELLSIAGIDQSKLSIIVPVQYSIIVNEIKYIVGASDGALANLAMNVVDANILAITIGTSAAARITIQQPGVDEQMRLFCYHFKENFFIKGGASNNGAIVLQWLKDNYLQTGESINALIKAAETVSPGVDGLIFLPYVYGERAPLWDSNAKEKFIGLKSKHTKSYFVRAAMEGVLYNLLLIANMLNEKNSISEIHAGGGFAENPFWVQMLSDIFNLPVKVFDSIESSALGAVMLGTEIKTEPTKTYQPNQNNFLIYSKQFERFKQLALGD
ncbi:MAG: gluconokinase [Bacteroidota bacterium]|nr:gluconokinase [Bacteroidota bacterium]